MRGWILGTAEGEEEPVYLVVAAALCALRLVWEQASGVDFSADLIKVSAGDSVFCRHMNEWHNTGVMRLRSAAAAEMVRLRERISGLKKCPRLFCPAEFPSMYEKRRMVELDDPATVGAVARKRLRFQILGENKQLWGERLGKIPRTSDEVKQRVKAKYERDEAKLCLSCSERDRPRLQSFRRLASQEEL